MHREARGDDHGGVDRGHEHRDVRAGRGPRVPLHDPQEEVGREERSEEHHLGDDEEVDAEGLGVYSRGLIGLGRAVMLVLVNVGGYGTDFHQAAAPS